MWDPPCDGNREEEFREKGAGFSCTDELNSPFPESCGSRCAAAAAAGAQSPRCQAACCVLHPSAVAQRGTAVVSLRAGGETGGNGCPRRVLEMVLQTQG